MIEDCPQNARGIYKKGDEGAYRRLECVRKTSGSLIRLFLSAAGTSAGHPKGWRHRRRLSAAGMRWPRSAVGPSEWGAVGSSERERTRREPLGEVMSAGSAAGLHWFYKGL